MLCGAWRPSIARVMDITVCRQSDGRHSLDRRLAALMDINNAPQPAANRGTDRPEAATRVQSRADLTNFFIDWVISNHWRTFEAPDIYGNHLICVYMRAIVSFRAKGRAP